ncbi:transketolase [Actinoplanes philippinensis]|uniref:Transketolase n=1 Tax=Actinoplanes philippinensis TaxID=35752 RepID=A0A1I2N110_9ACTN|nr:thiamine pyrophosphate-dependent enzyme [Actinoplanes philippinensis]SFF96569.1 transketolase [Actinoplanes philippinensis]
MKLLSRVTADVKHSPSAHSTLDVLWVLYDRVLRITPETVDDPGRDRFFLSKGHGPAAYYAVLAAKGFIPEEWLDDMGGWDSPLGHHPDRVLIPGVEIGTGSLGHGLGLTVGAALGLRAQGYLDTRTFVLLGDAELDEGSNHEAIAYAAAIRLPITAIVVDNRSSTHGWPGGWSGAPTWLDEDGEVSAMSDRTRAGLSVGIPARFPNWGVSVVDGRDRDGIEQALRVVEDRPRLVVAAL